MRWESGLPPHTNARSLALPLPPLPFSLKHKVACVAKQTLCADVCKKDEKDAKKDEKEGAALERVLCPVACGASKSSTSSSSRKTLAGDACAKSFAYEGKTYTGACTSVDVKKGEWCYLPKGAKGKDGKNWGMCVAKGSVVPVSAAAGSCRFVMEETACSITAAGAGRDTANTVSALQVIATYINGNDEPVSRAFDGGRKAAESWCRSVFRSAAVVPAGPFADTAAYAKFVDEAGIGSPDKLQKWEKESGGSNML